MLTEQRVLSAIIVDDEAPGRDALNSALVRIGGVNVIAECSDGLSAIERISERQPDVVFLDVQMPEVDGFGVVFGVGVEKMPPVVMVTAHDKFALKAFDVHAVDYLLKPYTGQRLAEAVHRVRWTLGLGEEGANARRSSLTSVLQRTMGVDGNGDGVALGNVRGFASRIMVKHGERVRFVPVGDVDYFEADNSHVHLHVGAEIHSVRRTLKDVQAQLDPAKFVRIHRSTIVNLDRLKEVQPWFSGDYVAILQDGTQLRVSRAYRDDLLKPQF